MKKLKLNTKRVLQEIERLGLNKNRVATEMGVHRPRVTYIFKNPDKVGLRSIEKLGDLLGVDPKELIL